MELWNQGTGVTAFEKLHKAWKIFTIIFSHQQGLS